MHVAVFFTLGNNSSLPRLRSSCVSVLQLAADTMGRLNVWSDTRRRPLGRAAALDSAAATFLAVAASALLLMFAGCLMARSKAACLASQLRKPGFLASLLKRWMMKPGVWLWTAAAVAWLAHMSLQMVVRSQYRTTKGNTSPPGSCMVVATLSGV